MFPVKIAAKCSHVIFWAYNFAIKKIEVVNKTKIIVILQQNEKMLFESFYLKILKLHSIQYAIPL